MASVASLASHLWIRRNLMTDNELNLKVCEGLGWKTNKEWNPNTWDVPLDQPWFRDWGGETTAICPDFLASKGINGEIVE
jgi:hypothetical protein